MTANVDKQSNNQNNQTGTGGIDDEIVQKLLGSIQDLGLSTQLKDVKTMLNNAHEMIREKADHETLDESILYQYAYLENLIQVCKDERNPSKPSQKLLRGKDEEYNSHLDEARRMCKKVLRMADKAVAECAAAADAGPEESRPYDKKYYGELKDVKEFKASHHKTTVQVLRRAGGKFSSLK